MKTKLLLSMLLLCGSLSPTFAQVVLTESFNVTANTNVPPTGWTVTSTGSTGGCFSYDWEQVPSGGFVCPNNGTPQPSPTPNSGTGMAGFNSWDIAAGSSSDLVTPALNFTGLGTYEVDFYVFEQQMFYGDDSLRVLINTSPTSVGGTLLAEYVPNYSPPTSYGWAHYTLSIPTTFTGATNYIIFRGVSDYGYDVFIDDVTVTRIPPTACSGTPSTPSISNAVMTTPLCMGSTATLNGVDPNLPMTSGITYQWETSASAAGPWTAVTAGSGATSLTYTTPSMATSAWFRMALTCAASSTTIHTGAYLVQVGAPQPSMIQGMPTYCPGDVETYSVTAVAGTTYTWTLPPGWTGSSTTNSISVTPVPLGGSGTISVTATSSCGTSIPQTLTITPGSAPSPPNGITGNALFCSNTSQTYSVTPVSGATSYIWVLPSGWSGTSTTNTITATNTISSGSVSVRAVNGCGQSPATQLRVNSLNGLDPVGSIFGKDTVCGGALNTYYIHAVPGATSYIWTLPSGWSGTTTDTLIKVFPGSAGGLGTISVTAYVSCATSSPASKSVRVIPSVLPTVTLSAPPGTICAGKVIQITATPGGGGSAPAYQWFKNGNPISNSGPAYITNTLAAGDVLQVNMTSNEVCANPTIVSSNLLAPSIIPGVVPGVSIDLTPGNVVCSGTQLHFTSTSNGTGTQPGYQWQVNGVDVRGAIGVSFNTSNLADGDIVTLKLTSNANCAPAGGTMSNKITMVIRDTLIPQVSIAVSPGNVIDPGDEVTFTATPVNGGSTPTYQWIRNGVTIPFETNQTYTTSSLRPGDVITVRMLSYLNCAHPPLAFSNEIKLVSDPLSVGTTETRGTFNVYPNPSQGQLRLNADLSALNGAKGLRAEIMNTIGQVVHRVEFPMAGATDFEATIELPAHLANGQYLLQLRNTGAGAPVHLVQRFTIVR